VIKGGQETAFGDKPSSNEKIGPERSWQLLDCHRTAELTVATREHNAPRPAAQLLPYFIGGKG
jgi:hypothetical protein